MEVKLFYKTQRELATAINVIIDAYWESKVSEETLLMSIRDMYINNRNKWIKENGFTTILKQQCGKRRLEVVERILKINGLLNENEAIV